MHSVMLNIVISKINAPLRIDYYAVYSSINQGMIDKT